MHDDVDTIGKATRLLGLLGTAPDGATLSQLARASGFPTSSAHRLLASLRRDGFVAVDPATKRYSLGLRLFQLGTAVAVSRGFSGAALPVLRALTGSTGEASVLSVLDGDAQLTVHHVEGRHAVGVRATSGGREPLHSTATGKVLVAFAPPREREQLLDGVELTTSTPRTISTRTAFREEIAAVSAQGFAVSDEEHRSGIRSIGVPVPGTLGHAVAAVSISSPAYRTTVSAAMRYLPALHEAAHELAVVLPHR